MKTLVLFLSCLCLSLPGVLSQGAGCAEDPVPNPDRVDCHPEPDSSEEACRARDCTWCPAQDESPFFPWCYVSHYKNRQGYTMVGQPVELENGYRVNLQRTGPPTRYVNGTVTRWDGEAENLILDVDFQSNTRVRIKISDGTPRWEVPLTINPSSDGNTNRLYEVTFANDPLFSFKVVRRSTGAVLFNAGGSNGNFIFAEQYLTLAWQPATANVYGVGENEQPTFKHNFDRSVSWALWAKDQVPDFDANLYGVQPYYTVLEADGNAHSVAVVNSNAQQWDMFPGPLIKWTSIGGIMDFYVFLGPTPENTVQQYTEAVGRPQMPPYWGLGFQLCRYGYNNLATMKGAVDRTAQYDIPHDVQYGDIDIMYRQQDFTYDTVAFAGLPEYIMELKAKGIKFMTILDPFITTVQPAGTYRAFDLGQQMDVWMKRADGSNAVGRVWPGNMQDPVYFPDYSKSSAREWWITLITEFHDLLAYDGLWIDMNEPANFVVGDINGCANNKWTNPPYLPKIRGGNLAEMTVCADNVHAAGRHYDTHSIYGWFMSEPTLAGVRSGTGKRGLVLSRSTFLGSGKWVAHWLGDNFSRWSNLHFSIIGMLQYNMFGIPFAGSDICGFNENTNAEMCQRWMELGAFYPFSRNHNGWAQAEQDPGVFGPEVAASSRTALLVRYTLLPYLYTLFYQSHINGNTVVRALWHEFPTDEVATGIDRQFLWGSGVLVSPVLDQGATDVRAYFPDARVYDYYTGSEVATKGGYLVLPAPRSFIPVHVMGGNILPTQEPAVNTELSRNNPFGFIVALDSFASAFGSLYYDDGDSLEPVESGAYFNAIYSASARTFRSSVVTDGYAGMASKTIGTVRLLGAGPVTAVTVNGAAHTSFEQLPSGEVVITNLGLRANADFIITY